SAAYKRSLREVFSLAVGKGFMNEISIGREYVDVQAILKATPNVDPTSSDTFIDAYEKLFDRRYPYVDKVVRMYLLDPNGFMNEISIGREYVDVQAILKATPNVDPTSSDTFIDAYEKLFDRRYPYVDKISTTPQLVGVAEPAGIRVTNMGSDLIVH
nr:hypothetical protein [Tanacetum cinerariifolium]